MWASCGRVCWPMRVVMFLIDVIVFMIRAMRRCYLEMDAAVLVKGCES